ncbi:MAG: RAD55 family ATPase [Gemmatimonadota bacterium]
MAATERLRTDVPGLDRLLSGGLRRSGLHLIAGPPGTGKTILTHQIAAGHARADQNAVYLTALVESHDTLIAQARRFDFFDASVVGRTLYYAGLYPALAAGGLAAAREEVTRIARERRPLILALDGLHVVKSTASTEFEFSRFMNELQTVSSVIGTTILTITNASREPVPASEYAMSDGVFRLERRPRGDGIVRTFAVDKLRGADHVAGVSTFRIDSSGIRIFPRLEGVAAIEGVAAHTPMPRRVPFGVPGLDTMMHGGIASGTVTMLAGAAGAGKTSVALSFLAAGAEADERGLLLTFHETPDRVIAKAEGTGIPLGEAVERDRVRIAWWPSAELLADEIAEWVLDRIDRDGIRRLVIDGLGDLRRALPTPERTPAFLNVFAGLLRARGVAVVLTQELDEILGPRVRIPTEAHPSVVDNIVLLRSVELRARLHRVVSILKMREHDYDTTVRELEISRRGIAVRGPLRAAPPALGNLGGVTSPERGDA